MTDSAKYCSDCESHFQTKKEDPPCEGCEHKGPELMYGNLFADRIISIFNLSRNREGVFPSYAMIEYLKAENIFPYLIAYTLLKLNYVENIYIKHERELIKKSQDNEKAKALALKAKR